MNVNENIGKAYLSVAELSELYNISRQTILYYDKHNLLKPKFVSHTGYRYYHFHEYQRLEVILNLRKIGLSIQEIKNYFEHKSNKALSIILDKKIAEYNQTIINATILVNDMQKLKAHLQTINDIKLNEFVTAQYPARNFIISNLVSKQASIKERIKELGHTNLAIYKAEHFKYFFTSWIITKNDFLSQHYNTNRFYCIPTNDNNNLSCLTLPAGLYLSYSFRGLYQKQSNDIGQEFLAYLHKNKYKLLSHVLIQSQQGYWLANTKNDYINTLSVCIHKNQ